MEIPMSTEILDVYSDLMGHQAHMNYENLRPSDVTRYILNIFNHKDEGLTVDVIHNIIQAIHDSFTTYDYDKISDISGVNILNDVREIKELLKRRKEGMIL